MIAIEDYLKNIINEALKRSGIDDFENILIENPRQKNFGDKSTNVAMMLTKRLKKNPRQIAEELISNLQFDNNIIEKTEIAGPGFINFYIATDYLGSVGKKILDSPSDWGKNNVGNNTKTLVEFVSANPTGPLTIGHGRQAVLGDTVARLLEWCGYKVDREYYFNDAGRQMRVLGESVRLRYLELLGEKIEFPDDHYKGEYITEIAQSIKDEFGESLKTDTTSEVFKERAEKTIFEDIKNTLSRMGIVFDNFYNEKDLYKNGKIEETLSKLKTKELLYEKDGAVWFKTTSMGMEQDRVLVKSSGEPTYRLPDIAYHQEKFNRGYELLVDLFGSDHIATYPDVLAALKALGFDSEKVKVLIHQFVTLYEGNKIIKMSTRKANFVTLDELMDEVGVDVTRYFFVMRSMDSHLNFDIKLAKQQSEENPVYYNQYAHARICSILRKAEFAKNDERLEKADWSLLKHAAEKELMKTILEFPRIVKQAGENFEPHRIPNYLTVLAQAFHKFYTECHVMVDNQELKLARLALCEASRITMANGLSVIGVSAPDKM